MMIMTRSIFPHFYIKSCVNDAATKRFWWFEYKQQRVDSWCVISSNVLFVSSGFSNGLCVRGVVSPPSRGGKERCHCRRSEDDDFTVVWRYNKAFFPVKEPQFLCGAMKTHLQRLQNHGWAACSSSCQCSSAASTSQRAPVSLLHTP